MAETPDKPPFPVIREAVAVFADKAALRRAVASLRDAGFKPVDFSVLASHDSLEVAGEVPGYAGKPSDTLWAGLTDEAPLLIPLTIAGLAFLSGGPVGAALGALAAAGLGGAALKELLDRYMANQHSTAVAEALRTGALLLWVRVDDPALEAPAVRLLTEAGGKSAHINARALGPKG
jgi:hypothetical protein